MNYESIVKKPNPFSGLSVQSRQRLVVYLCYVATPTMTPDMVRQRWGEVLSADDWPLAHEAMDLIDEIKKELVKRKRRRSILCVVLWTALILLCVGTPVFMVSISQQTEKVRLAKEHAKNARQDMQRQYQEAKSAGAKKHAIAEWNGAVGKWNSGDDKLQNGDYIGASELYRQSESLFVEAERISKVVKLRTDERLAKNARQDMQRQCQEAKSAGANEHAIDEWNRAIEKWNSGDDRLKAGDHVGASESYRQSESLFVEAERISKAVKLRTDARLAKNARQDMQRQYQEAKSAGAKEHAIAEWNRAVGKWNSGDDKLKTGDYVGASELYRQSESLFGEAERISKKWMGQTEVRLAKEHAENARQDMQRQYQEAKSAGANEHAIAEWNDAVGKWSTGDDKFKNGDYIGASELYRQSESLFVEAERISNARKAAELTAKLAELQDKAVTLVKESDKWWKWSVDDNALLEMGNAINMLLVEGEYISGFSVANRDELEELLVRCYELAANNGNGEACFRLFLLFGGESEKTLDARIVIKNDKDLSLKYLKRAADKGHPVAKEIYEDIQVDGLLETLKKDANDKTRRRTGDKASRPTRGPVRNSCSECGGTGYARYVIWTPTFLSKSAYRKEVRHMKCKKCRGSGRASF